MTAAQEELVASHNRLVTKHGNLWTENERTRGKLAIGKYNYILPPDLNADFMGSSKSGLSQDARGGEEGWPKAHGHAGKEDLAEALFAAPEQFGGWRKGAAVLPGSTVLASFFLCSYTPSQQNIYHCTNCLSCYE